MSASLAPIAGADEWTYTLATFPATWNTGVIAPDVSGLRNVGARSDPGLLSVTELVYTGDLVPAFGEDFFDRVHYSWLAKDLGNVISLQTLTLSVWNAFRRSETLNAFTPDNDEGITVSGVPTLPSSIPALRELTITFEVDISGPPTIAASYAFDWETVDKTVTIAGSRITAWSFIPDWSNGIIERLQWQTDVLQSFDMREQRRAMRIAPRKTFEFDMFLSDAERRYAEASIWGWGARVWALPIWTDGQELSASLPAGSTSISIDTTTRDFKAGGLAMILGDAFNFETLEILSVASGSITLPRPTARTWPTGTRVYPAREARLDESVGLQRWTRDVSTSRITFRLVEPVDNTASGGVTTYRGYPLLTREPNWIAEPTIDLQRKLAQIDNLTGVRYFDDESGLPSQVQRMRWMLTSRTEIEEVRQLLYAMRGRQGAAWVPTWTNDLSIVSTVDLSGTAIDVAYCGYTKQIAASTGRRDIRIALANGTVLYRRITTSTELSSTTERLSIDTALGVTVQPSDVAMISYIALMRLDVDEVDIAYWKFDTAEVAPVMRGFQHDL